MPNFLANLGEGLSRFGGRLSPEYEAGSRFGGDMRDRFKKRPGVMGAGAGTTDMFNRTASPLSAASATDMLEGAVAEGENAARAKLPITRPDENFDMMGELRAGGVLPPELPNLPDRGQMPAASAAPAIPEMGMPSMARDTSSLRDYRGRDVSNDRIGFERDLYMRGKQEGPGFRTNLAGEKLPMTRSEMYPRDWKMALKNAMLGAAASRGGGIEGMIGGALAGGAGSLINPMAGHEFAFEQGERPRLEADIRREREEEGYQRGQRMAGYDESLKRGQVDLLPIQADQERAQTEQMRANVNIAQQNAERQRQETESRISLNKAREKAIETGKWVKAMVYNPATGVIEEVWTNPNGQVQTIGESGQAKISERKDAAAMQRTQTQQAGATGRTAMAQAGATGRTQMNIEARQTAAEASGQGKSKLQAARQKSQGGQGGKVISEAEIQKYAGAKNMTPEKAREHWKSKGFTVTK